MKIETEIKIILKDTNIENLTNNIEEAFDLKRTKSFHQITHQFFFEDYTKQIAFPRVRNEENGKNTLTIKVKMKDDNQKENEYFKRIEMESDISDVESVIKMMPFFGYPKKVSWEKKRVNFISNKSKKLDFIISLDQTPMGYFLEIESDERRIEEIIKLLEIENLGKTKKAYLGIWEDYKKTHNITEKNCLFK